MSAERDVDLVTAEVETLISHLHPPPGQPFGVHLFRSDDPGSEIARSVERQVFCEAFNNSPEMLGEEYGPYEEASSLICVVDHIRRRPAAMIRVILPSPAGFKTMADLPRFWKVDPDDVLARLPEPMDPGRTWDIATLAVGADYRRKATDGLVSLALYQTLSVLGRLCDVGWMIAVVDVVVLDLLQQVLQRGFQTFPGVGPIRYLDSVSSVPVWANYVTWRQRLADTDPASHELLIEGRGLEAAVAPADWNAAPRIFRARIERGVSLAGPAATHR